ncbi:hypothetical protein SGFS_075770 [Streptomyces graminofaciens]|uniref:Transposase n=1 Tax=Streptomyces graminofaciens TaxID=68212 RepID=A0ABM7FJ53_9ACTN|nr:hypothetical protein SGFS_075770 [Streptomyces graminofaciens]
MGYREIAPADMPVPTIIPPSAQALRAQRRVPADGVVMVAGQRLRVGRSYAGKTLTIVIEGHRLPSPRWRRRVVHTRTDQRQASHAVQGGSSHLELTAVVQQLFSNWPWRGSLPRRKPLEAAAHTHDDIPEDGHRWVVLALFQSNARNLWIGAGRDAEGVPSRMIL